MDYFVGDNRLMDRPDIGPRLIIICGLPGSGKTTLAMALERRIRAVRFAPDEWMDALSVNIYDEERRGKIEALQWKLGQELIALGLTVIIEWGTWEGPSGMHFVSERGLLALRLSCITSPRRWRFSSRGFGDGPRRIHPSHEMK